MFSAKSLKISFNIFLLIIGIFAIIQMPLLAFPALGGVITNGILGGFSGKVGPVVGGKWKDIDYMRSYVIPANPNSSDQQTVRTKFSALVAYARSLLPTILQPFWDPYYSNMSGFNAFISENYNLLGASNLMDVDCIVAKGTLEIDTITAATKTAGSVSIEFAGTPHGNGLTTDTCIGVIVNNESKQVYFNTVPATRGDGQVDVIVLSADDPADYFAYIFFHRGTGSDLVVSDSRGHTVS